MIFCQSLYICVPDSDHCRLKKILVVFIGILLIFTMAGCSNDKTPPKEVEAPADKPIPVETPDVSAEEKTPKEYTGWAGAYLNILAENSVEVRSPYNYDSEIAILNVFEDETPELMYIYHYYGRFEVPDSDDTKIPCLALKIFSYSEHGEVELVFDSTIYIAAGGPNNYCVYLTREGELMLYRSNFSGGSIGCGIWQIVPNQNLEETDEYWSGEYNSDLAKLYYARFPGENDEVEKVYKSNGKEISKEQYDKTAKEIMNDIEHVIFPGIATLYNEDLWKGITPFESESMTYEEAVAWLEAQAENLE